MQPVTVALVNKLWAGLMSLSSSISTHI